MQKLLHTQFSKLLVLLVLLFGINKMFGQTTVSHTFSGTSGTIDTNIAFTTTQNGSGTAPTFTGGTLRLYYNSSGNGGSITLTPSNGAVITAVVLTATDGYTPTVRYNVNGGADLTPTFSSSAYTYSVTGANASTSLRLRNANTSNTQLRVTKIDVTYTPGGPTVATTTAIPTTTGATLNGTINAGGTATAASFNYGTSTSYGNTVAASPSSVTGSTTTNISATISSLAVNTQYYFRAVGTTTSAINGEGVAFYTLANVPGVPVVSNPTINSLNVSLNTATQNGNPSSTQYAIQVGSQYVQSSTGALSATASWATAATWGTKTVTGLTSSTTYTFSVKARNGDNIETAFGTTAQGTTLTDTTPRYSATTITTFGSLCINTTSTERSFTLTGSYLTGNVTVGALNGYSYSTVSNGTFLPSLTLTPSSGNINATVYVKLTPTTAGSYNGNIVVSGGGATSINVAATGTGINTSATISATTATSVLTTTATLGSNVTNEGCSAVSRGVVYGTSSNPSVGGSGVTQLTSSATGTGAFTVSATALLPATQYYARAYAINNGGTVYGTQVTFTTACASLALPFNENFEAATFPPSCWTSFRGTNNLGTSDDWIRTTSNTYNSSAGTAFVDFESVTSGQLTEDWLVTPRLIIPNNGSPVKLKFMERQKYSETYGTNYYIKVSTTSQTTHAAFTNVTQYGESAFSTTYTERVVDLTAYAGQTIYIAFVMSQNDGDGWYVDNVTVKEEVAAPVATAATNILPHSFTANWNSVTNATGYELDVATSPNFTDIILSENFSGFTASNTNRSTTLDNFLQTPGWTGVSVYDNPGSARIAAGSTPGSITTPTVNLSINGANATVSFKLEQYSNDTNTVVQVLHAADGTNFTQVGSNITVPSTPTIYTLPITGGTASSKIRVQSISGTSTRFYIDDIIISSSAILSQYTSVPVNTTSTSVTNLNQNTNYYYRVRATGIGSTSTNSNTITVTTGKELVWNGTQWTANATPSIIDSGRIDATYNTTTSGNFTIGELTIAPTGSVNVATGTTITVANSITNNSSLAEEGFKVQNNGAVVQTNNAVNSGTAKVIKNTNPLYRLDYTLWSSPVSGQTLGDFSPQTTVGRFYEYKYGYDATANNGAGANVEQYFIVPPSTGFAAAKSYLIRMPNGDSTPNYNSGGASISFEGKFIGEMHNGTKTITASTQGNRYTAVGNPYASPISVVDFFTANTNVIDAGSGIYFWRKKNNASASSYATLTLAAYTANGATSGFGANPVLGGGADQGIYFQGAEANWLISQGQGFIVKTKATPTEADIKFTNSMRRSAPASGNQAFLRTSAQSQPSRLWVNLSNANNGFSQTAIAYLENATTGIDYGYDGRQLTDNNNVVLYTISNDINLAVQARPAFNVNDSVPMGFIVATAGEYKLSLDHTDGVFNNGQLIYVRDNATGLTHDITNGDYTFTTTAGTFNDRFDVIYTTQALGTNTPVLNAGSVIVYKQDRTLNISSATAEIASVTVFDVRGRKLYTADNINSTEAAIAGLQVANEVIIIEINTVKGKVSKKVVY